MTLKDLMRGKLRDAFTLIELLAVIAIIGLLAAMVLGLSGLATTKSREARMRGEHAKLLTAIEGYKAEIGHYPQDHPDITKVSGTNRYELAGKNSLFYELSGATFENTGGGQFTTLNKSESVKVSDLTTVLKVKGIENSARRKPEVPYQKVTFRTSQYAELAEGEDVEILIAPIKGPWDQTFEKRVKSGAKQYVNPWFYDASSTNRHNLESFDLWSEYLLGKDTKVISNWKD